MAVMAVVQEILSKLEKLGVNDKEIMEYIGLKDRHTIGLWWKGRNPIHKNLFKLKRLLEITEKYQTYDPPTWMELWKSFDRWIGYEEESEITHSKRREMFKNRLEYGNDWDNTEYKLITLHIAVEVCAKWHPNDKTRQKFSEILGLF
jgi:hypothetical protein